MTLGVGKSVLFWVVEGVTSAEPEGSIDGPVEVRTSLLSILLACLALTSNSAARTHPGGPHASSPDAVARGGSLFSHCSECEVGCMNLQRQLIRASAKLESRASTAW